MKGHTSQLAVSRIDGTRRHGGLLFDNYWYDGKLTDADNVELKTTLQELALDLAGDAVETNVALRVDACSRHGRHFRRRDGLVSR